MYSVMGRGVDAQLCSRGIFLFFCWSWSWPGKEKKASTDILNTILNNLYSRPRETNQAREQKKRENAQKTLKKLVPT